MKIFDILIIGIGLAMDAVVVSMAKGMTDGCNGKCFNTKKALILGFFFGFFQFLMPIAGYYLGNSFLKNLEFGSSLFSFIILSIVGIKMILESFKKEDKKKEEKLQFKEIILLSLATSIDAFAIGVSFSLMEIHIVQASFIIGAITFFLTVLGGIIGFKFGRVFENRITILGGLLLIAIGFKILLF